MGIRSISAVNPERLPVWGRKIGFGLLVVSSGYALTQLMQLFSGSTITPAPNDPIQTQAQTHPLAMAAVDPVQEVSPVPETQLKLKLVGVLSAGEGGSALIDSQSGEEKVYSVGDTVPGNSRLKAVFQDSVLLEGNRGLVTLRLSTRIRSANSYGGPSEAPGQSEMSQSSDADMAQYFVPAISATGELVGYRVSPNNRQPRLQQLGLLPTDIITAVHAFPLIQLENRIRALQRLRDDEFASITFIRDGNKLINMTILPDAEVRGSD